MAQDKVNKLAEIIREVERRSAADEAFRNKALTDPAAAINEVANEKVNTEATINFVESDGKSSFTIALPPAIGGEMSDLDLEAVAGGKASHTAECGSNTPNCVTNSGVNSQHSATNISLHL